MATDRLFIATADGLGIQFDKDNNRIVPIGADGSTYNNNVSLGSSGLEFKNLALSGTATMAGLTVDGECVLYQILQTQLTVKRIGTAVAGDSIGRIDWYGSTSRKWCRNKSRIEIRYYSNFARLITIKTSNNVGSGNH